MQSVLMPIAFVVLIWWTSTGAVLWLARGFDQQMHFRLIFMTIVCALGFAGVLVASAHQGIWTVYLGFASAIAIWGWVEFTLLSGLITGNHQAPCPEDVTESQRFMLAFRTIAHHEYALVAMLIVLAVLDSTGGTGMAVKTFALLWVMRLGAKLTIFSGAPELSVHMMPERLAYMKTYFRHDRVGIAFWLSVAVCLAFFLAGMYALLFMDYSTVIRTQVIILTTLVGLALIEHAFMVLPVADSKLWQWALPPATRKPLSNSSGNIKLPPNNLGAATQEYRDGF